MIIEEERVEYHYQAAETPGATPQCVSGYKVITHCQEGLALLERLPDTSERQRQELALRMILSATLAASRGFGMDELVQISRVPANSVRRCNDDATLVSVLVGLGGFYDRRADREAIEQLTGEELCLLGRIQEPRLAIQLYTHLGTSSMACGALRQAQEYHARVLELEQSPVAPRARVTLWYRSGGDGWCHLVLELVVGRMA